ncbi:hypothetical protein BR1R5_33930 [Pseudomonas sp. BR1R-5]|uniref:hypothetical protein n=1 Tax=Pseudomonas sp. BR1R-5 TaxID=3003626 RepID=UPI0022C8C907|nr:hypothetical protein [Pseudomonas sp. BR1R-5]GLH34005.1 hypothetical protein BR1R5_33930 [Pseudomonas sp. BR1R-5]
MAAKKTAQEPAKDQVDQVSQALDTPATGPAPVPDLGNGSDGNGNPTPGDGASAASDQASTTGATQEAAAPASGSASSDGAAGSGESVAADEDLRKRPYLVTGLIDVRHDGELYTKGETLWLYQFSATPLLNKRYITPKEGQ